MSQGEASARTVVLLTKVPRPGRVKTRLIGALSAEQTAQLHAAFLADITARLRRGHFALHIAWALADDEELPAGGIGFQQEGDDLGTRIYHALSSRGSDFVVAIGSDHPEITLETVESAFTHLENGADIAIGPAADGGYYLFAARREALRRELFEDITWSTSVVLEQTLERCREHGLKTELLVEGHDVDLPEDLDRLCARLATSDLADCLQTREVLASWGRL